MSDPSSYIKQSERRVEIEQRVREQRQQEAYYYQNRFNFDLQDNNAADPEQADLDDIREEE